MKRQMTIHDISLDYKLSNLMGNATHDSPRASFERGAETILDMATKAFCKVCPNSKQCKKGFHCKRLNSFHDAMFSEIGEDD